MLTKISEDEIIGVWLKNELRKNWTRIRQYLNPSIKDDYVLNLIKNPDYSNTFENLLRLKILSYFRSKLLLSLIGAEWNTIYLKENKFKKLKVINEAGWNIISNFSGDLSEVAKNIENRKLWEKNPRLSSSIKEIYKKEEELDINKLDKKIFLINSKDSAYTTIIEGNKKAIVLYRKCFLKKDLNYKPIKFFIGSLKAKSFWQW